MISFGIVLTIVTVVSASFTDVAIINQKRSELLQQLKPMIPVIPTVLANLDEAIKLAPGIHDQLLKVNVGSSDAKDQLRKIYVPLKEKIDNSMHAFGGSFPEEIPEWSASELQRDMVSTINHALDSYAAFRAHLTTVQKKAPEMIAKLEALDASAPDAADKLDAIMMERIA